MKTILIGNGYWGKIIKPKLEELTNLQTVIGSKENIDEILENYEIDFAFICTPTNTHYDLVKKCINKNINVFCEKPFTGDFNNAKKLYNLAKEKKVKIYVDNIFLERKEFELIKPKEYKKIKFKWFKKEEILKENIFNTLLYHDLYILLSIYDVNWKKINMDVTYDKLNLFLQFNELTADFEYDRCFDGGKIKKIYLDENQIDFSSPLNDPLYEIISKLKNNQVNYNKNMLITLKTLELMNELTNS
jgi:hypothetical protein